MRGQLDLWQARVPFLEREELLPHLTLCLVDETHNLSSFSQQGEGNIKWMTPINVSLSFYVTCIQDRSKKTLDCSFIVCINGSQVSVNSNLFLENF